MLNIQNTKPKNMHKSFNFYDAIEILEVYAEHFQGMVWAANGALHGCSKNLRFAIKTRIKLATFLGLNFSITQKIKAFM